MKKMMALLLALVMVLGLTATAWADNDPEETTEAESETQAAEEQKFGKPLTVSGLTEGDSVAFYKVIEWVGGDAEGNVAGWKAVSPFNSVLDKDTLTKVLVGVKADPNAIPPVEEAEATGITSELAGQLAAAAGTAEKTVVAEGATVTYTNTAPGMWMALVTPKDADTIYNPAFVSSNWDKEEGGTVAMGGEYADAVAKKTTVTLKKEADTSPEDTIDDQKSTTTAVGDTVKFTVTTTVPGYGEVYTNPHFVLKDELTALELKADTENASGFDVVVEGVPATYKDEDGEDQDSYTIAATASGYTVTFAPGYLKTLKTAVENVKIKYSAIVTTAAEKAVNEEDNTVSVEYSHNPNEQDDYDIKKDTTQHYTFTLDASGVGEGEKASQKGKETSELVKTGVDAAGKPIIKETKTSTIEDGEKETWEGPLAQAVFGLFTDAEGKTPYKDKDGNEVTATTGTDGRMTFTGLDAGTYYLKEISAPEGYVTNPTVHTVEITATTKSVKVTEYYKDGEWSATDNGGKKVEYETDILESYKVTVDGKTAAEYQFKNQATASSTEIDWEKAECVEHPFELENVQGVELPSTGGIGTTIFYIVGAILVLGAGVALITKKRMSAM